MRMLLVVVVIFVMVGTFCMADSRNCSWCVLAKNACARGLVVYIQVIVVVGVGVILVIVLVVVVLLVVLVDVVVVMVLMLVVVNFSVGVAIITSIKVIYVFHDWLAVLL